MLKISNMVVLAFAALALAACGKVEQQVRAVATAKPVTLVFAPGWRILSSDATAVPVQGFDACPKTDPATAKFFGEGETDGKHSCIVVGPETTQVSVLIPSASGSVTEQWGVLRDPDDAQSGNQNSRVRLRRPDGSLVVAATPQ